MGNEVSILDVSEKIFGVSARRYRQLAHDKIVPPVVNGKIDFVAAAKAVIAYYRGLAESKGDPLLNNQKIRLEKLQADRLELKLEQERENLIETDLAIKSWGNVCQAIRGRLLSLPYKLAPMVIGSKSVPETKDIIENYVLEVMKEIANPSLRTRSKEPNRQRSRNAKTAAKAENQ